MAVEGALADIRESSEVLAALARDSAALSRLEQWAETCSKCIEGGGTLYFAGNGGSFSDAQHLAAELVGKMRNPRPPLAGLALGSNGCAVTAIGNDFEFADVFAREFTALARPNSVLLVLTTSGNSENIVRLVGAATEIGVPAYGLTGGSGGHLASLCETIIVPSSRTERIQEAHIALGHVLCRLIEDHLSEAESFLPGR